MAYLLPQPGAHTDSPRPRLRDGAVLDVYSTRESYQQLYESANSLQEAEDILRSAHKEADSLIANLCSRTEAKI
jgi:hypothetical protein